MTISETPGAGLDAWAERMTMKAVQAEPAPASHAPCCRTHPIFGHEDQCRYVGMGAVAETSAAPGPCQLQSSPFCEGTAAMVRLDPMAMAPENPAPPNTIPTCQECFDHRSDQYLRAAAR